MQSFRALHTSALGAFAEYDDADVAALDASNEYEIARLRTQQGTQALSRYADRTQ